MSDTAIETAQRVTVTVDRRSGRRPAEPAGEAQRARPCDVRGARGGRRASHDEPGLRVVVLSGEGPDFCAGLDFASFQAMREATGFPRPLSSRPRRADQGGWPAGRLRVGRASGPVIAAVRGNALGGGLQIALGADIRIVAPDARLSVFEVAWGLIPDMTGTQLLPELVGRDVAKELTYTARIVSGEEAVRIGLATRADPDPLAAAFAMAKEIAGRSPHAIRAAKRLLDLAGRTDLASGFAAEQEEIRALIGSPNQVEAVTARFEKRDPIFGEA